MEGTWAASCLGSGEKPLANQALFELCVFGVQVSFASGVTVSVNMIEHLARALYLLHAQFACRWGCLDGTAHRDT